MIKMKHIIWDNTAKEVAKFVKLNLTIPETLAWREFIEQYDRERKTGILVHGRIKDKLTEEDPQTKQEWQDYLDTDVAVTPLPQSILHKIETIMPEEYIWIENLFEKAEKSHLSLVK